MSTVISIIIALLIAGFVLWALRALLALVIAVQGCSLPQHKFGVQRNI